MSFLSISKKFDSTPHEVVYKNGKVRLLHYVPYKENQKNEDGSRSTAKPALLMIYAPINRFHILDINQDKSIVAQLLRKGINVYLLDWGYPDKNEDKLSINDYINYIDEAVQIIQKRGKSNKVSLLGYCWGGIFALIYCALNNSIIQNLILMATPVDFSKDNTILAEWSRALDSNKIVEEFGHIDGQILDLGFIMRNPPRYLFDKYLKFFRKLNDKEFVDIFISVEKWLYDTPAIPGNLYRQLINDCYRKNKLVSNTIYVDGKQIDLRKIDVPLLSIVAEGDDLASPESSLEVNRYVSSKYKTDMRNPGGHVGLCISSSAHEKLWPKVTEWILAHN